MFRKILFVSADAFAAASYVMARTAHQLVSTKLGVRRWLNFHEARLLESVPVDAIARCVSLSMLACAVFFAARTLSRRQIIAASYASIVSLAASGASCAFAFFASTEDFRAYYLMLQFFTAAAAVELARGSAVYFYFKGDHHKTRDQRRS